MIMRRFLYVFTLVLCLSVVARGQSLIDTTVGLADGKGVKTYQEMTHILCDGLRGDHLKANAIYNWITHNIKYDVDAVHKNNLKAGTAEKTFSKRLAVCDGYARLFSAMCGEAGLKAVNIEGYAKDWIFDNGDKLTIPRHMWCAVLINAQWQLVDPTWGAGHIVQAPTTLRKIINTITFKKTTYSQRLVFRFRYDTTYFTQDPLAFRYKHLPADPCWQLTDTAMPLAVFEAGDSAVAGFNARYAGLKQNSAELMRISSIDPDSVLYDASDRAYTFNERFPGALAMKQIARSNADVNKVLAEQDPEKGKELYRDAEKGLKIAEAHIKEQKKLFPDQYNTLKKKNRTKNTEAKQHMMQMTADNRKLLSQCGKYKHTCETKYTKNRKKYADANKLNKGLDPSKINNLEPAKQQKPASSPEMMALADSVKTREHRIDSLQKDIARRTAALELYKEQNTQRLDSLAKSLGRSDSFLAKEAMARLGMQDEYDNEVIMWSSLYKTEKFMGADTLHRYYTSGFDTIIQMSDDRYKVNTQLLNAYKGNLRDIEKYAKWNSSDTAITDRYSDVVSDYQAAIDSCAKDLLQTIVYIRANKVLFSNLGNLYKRQLKIVAYMKQVEEIRKKLEMNYIAGKERFDNNENKQQAAILKNAIRNIQQAYK